MKKMTRAAGGQARGREKAEEICRYDYDEEQPERGI